MGVELTWKRKWIDVEGKRTNTQNGIESERMESTLQRDGFIVEERECFIVQGLESRFQRM